MEKIEQTIEKVRCDDRYLYDKVVSGNAQIHDFRLERGIMTPERLSAFLENFSGQDIAIIAQEAETLKSTLKSRGYRDLAERVMSPSEYKQKESIAVLAGGMLAEELLKKFPDQGIIIKVQEDQYFKHARGNREIMKNFQDRQILTYQYNDMRERLEEEPSLNMSNVGNIIEKMENREYPGKELKKIAEDTKDSAEEIADFTAVFEKLRDIEYPFDENEIARYVVCSLLEEIFEQQAETQEDRKERIDRVKDFYANESVKRSEREDMRRPAFVFDDPEAAFLEKYSPILEEATAALEILRESGEAEKMADEDISYNDFYAIASKVLAVPVIRDREFFRKLKNADRLVLFIQDIYADRALLRKKENE